MTVRALGLLLAVATIDVAGAHRVRAADPLEVRLTIRNHQFDPAEAEVPAGRDIKLFVTNADDTPEEFESVGLKVERVIRPGQTAEFRIRPLLANRNYSFFGEFHPDTAKGRLIVK
jgi:hypothetical protein